MDRSWGESRIFGDRQFDQCRAEDEPRSVVGAKEGLGARALDVVEKGVVSRSTEREVGDPYLAESTALAG